ncbi:integrator complex assembly factor Brat1 [Calliopsis andreniformis]|uniref:integrator complex assembly factor Brat1 n=1 Tax=Calliopsis andreniformis TaxID=337506 RepID=UPI003FCC8044
MMTSLKNDEKLAEVLELFLLPNYNIVSTSYLDLLLTHISKDIKECSKNDYEHCELFQKWVLKALDTWSSDCKPSQSISIFTLKLVGIISCDELRFHHWQCKNVYNRLCDLLKLRKDDLAASVKMAYTIMLSELIKHRSGREWIIESGVWKDIVKYAHWNHTLYVTRESHKFLWLLLLHEYQNINFCKEVILTISAPLITKPLESKVHPVSEDNYLEQNKLLCTTLDLLISIIENTLSANMDNNIPELCEEIIDLDIRVKALFETCLSTKLFPHVHKLLLLCLLIPIKRAIREGQEIIDVEISRKFCYNLCYMSMILLSKKYVIELVKMNKLLLVYWKKLQSLRKFVLPNEHKLEHQAISIMVLPLATCIKHSYVSHDLFDMFITKMFIVTCTAIQRLAYNIRDTIFKNDLPVAQISKGCIDMLLEITEIMDRDIAVITFQTLCHVLKNCVPYVCDGAKNTSNVTNSENGPRKHVFKSPLEGDPMIEHPTLLASLLNGLAVMTEKFKLKWQECVETICLTSLAQEILNHPGIVPMVSVNALKVCKLSIQNFMPPNLVLLVETDSHMNEIGPTLFKRLHDVNWEVRDSVLEVLNTIAIISEDKYPAFQEFLLVNQFLQVAVEIAKTDSESYVRASALTFVASTVRIQKLWEQKLSQLNLPDFAIYLFNNESEAIVRKEAVILIKELYVHCKLPKNVVDSMSQAMAIAAVSDLHWEVKISALEYWKQFIKSHLSDQGVLDGHFPKVTFSKEHRKIVSLNETEIKRRLNKALDELAKQNCLGVLLVTLEDDSDFEVCRTSATIINTLKGFLLKYKLNEPFPQLPLPKDSATIDVSYIKRESVNSVENSDAKDLFSNSSNVIDEIVDVNDTNLLVSIYKHSMKMDEGTQKAEEKTFQFISCVTRQTFLQTIFNSDIHAYIEEKSRWLTTYTTSFESTLDDILTLHQQGDVNSMDCY